MSRFLIKSDGRLTERGRVGAFLFAGGPIVAAAFYFLGMWDMQANPYGGMYVLYLPIAAAAGIAALVGFVLLISGRTFTHEVQVLPDQESSR